MDIGGLPLHLSYISTCWATASAFVWFSGTYFKQSGGGPMHPAARLILIRVQGISESTRFSSIPLPPPLPPPLSFFRESPLDPYLLAWVIYCITTVFGKSGILWWNESSSDSFVIAWSIRAKLIPEHEIPPFPSPQEESKIFWPIYLSKMIAEQDSDCFL